MTADGPTVTVDRAGELMHCSRRKVFELLERGTLRRAKSFGRQTLVVTASIYEALEVEPVAVIPSRPRSRRETAELMAARFEAGRAERWPDRRGAKGRSGS